MHADKQAGDRKQEINKCWQVKLHLKFLETTKTDTIQQLKVGRLYLANCHQINYFFKPCNIAIPFIIK